MKTLIVISHPDIENSNTQQFLLQGAKHQNVDTLHLDNYSFNSQANQQSDLEKYDRIIFQFPLYWYSAPYSLKKWIDEVFTRGFVYGSESKLIGKEFGIVVSTGMPEKNFAVGGGDGYSIDQIMTPYYALARRAGMQILPTLKVFQFYNMSEREHMNLLVDYQRYITQKYPDTLENKIEWFINQFDEQVDEFDNSEPVKNLLEDLGIELDTLKLTVEDIKNGGDSNE
ncbi:NAD(P)H-dependent oxidoreductase [Companilactobacillus metriopterae]|uniref:NAD(P)H-dependent oxidoreductase n=1 Tax=Companilactobacillus metriopterae TaxID=1909267 RepID=UPI00100A25E2|nr:NAD(P)H-dependent oxidoreductase [Companilactobacillus metriopterae]